MSLELLPSEILLHIIRSSSDDVASSGSICPILPSLRSTCRRFAGLLSSQAPYLSPSLLPTLPEPQTYQTLNTYLPADSRPQAQDIRGSGALDDLITHLSRSFVAHSLISRIEYALESEQQRQTGISANVSEYANAIRSIPMTLCALRNISTVTDILFLPSCPPSARDATSYPQEWRTTLLLQHLQSVNGLDAFDALIAVLFALSNLLNEQRRSWLVTVRSYEALTIEANDKASMNEKRQSIGLLADELLGSEVSSPQEEQFPTYAYTSLHKFKTAELILRKGPRWVNELISRLEESEAEMVCFNQTSSPVTGSPDNSGVLKSTEDRVRELLIPMEKIETRCCLNEVTDTSFVPVADGSTKLPLMRLIWKERERKTAWQIREEKERKEMGQHKACKDRILEGSSHS